MNKRINLVTGGAGFIGSHLCEALLERGEEVYCLDNLITGKEKNIKELLSSSKFHFLKTDVIQPLGSDIKEKLKDIDCIFHLASPASPKKYQEYPIETLMVNSLGTYLMLNLAKENGARFIFASTSEVYGDPREHPQKESYWGNVNPIGIRSCYDEGKRFGEALVFAFIRKHDLDARVARIFNTYGPKMDIEDGRVVSNFICQAIKEEQITIYGDGTQTRSFCFISDMIEGILKVAEKDKARGEVFNLGNPDERSILEIAQLIKNLSGSSSSVVFESLPDDDPSRRLPDITRAKVILGWEPQITLSEGLQRTINYFQELLKQSK